MTRQELAGAVGNCVHVAGVVGFLHVAEELGCETLFLGAAVGCEEFAAKIKEHDPEIVGVSYRLTPEVARRVLAELRATLEREGLTDRRFVFGGTPPVCQVAEEAGWFERTWSGLENPQEVWTYLGGKGSDEPESRHRGTQLERLAQKRPYPLIRHHFGLPTMKKTLSGVRKIAESGVLDVISIAPDQNAQESFFRPTEMDPMLDGAGGVPVRSAEDLRQIYEASRRGNYPLLRIYSGTRDLMCWAELASETINNAWGAVPLTWYSVLDGRSERPVAEAIRENQETMRWYAERGIPVEVNESHHWSMRDSHDALGVAMGYLAALNAKRMSVRNYIAQYMWNSPAAVSGKADLAKMLAMMELIESLHDEGFQSMRQVRAGLLHLSPNPNVAKGQLAASTALAMQMEPHIIHVVGFCEGDHAATADDVIESCEIVHGVIRNTLSGRPDANTDPEVVERKEELISEARLILEAVGDPTDPENLAAAVKSGLIDAPQLAGNPHAAGRLVTRVIDGEVRAVDPRTKLAISESERLRMLPEG
ncbi:MAG: cobalamin B12-binding domain-containing protein [Armatimonadota bacterium]